MIGGGAVEFCLKLQKKLYEGSHKAEDQQGNSLGCLFQCTASFFLLNS
jgi:hypothetical protein